jgi:hypothetical protein
MLCGTSAPNIINLVDNMRFVFECPFDFTDRYSGQDDYFKSVEDIEPDPVRGLAMRRTNFVPDLVNCELPLDNRRSPGYRRVEPWMGGNRFYLWIGQHETGRYSKAHKHASAAVLLCLKGKGYTYTWPAELGMNPWSEGKGHLVKQQNYEYGGLVSAAPMSGDWFHQHFGIGTEPLRVSAWHGPNNQRSRKAGLPGEAIMDYGAIDLKKGGSAIPYCDEDPHLRQEFGRRLAEEGVKSRMEDAFYVDAAAGDAVGNVM